METRANWRASANKAADTKSETTWNETMYKKSLYCLYSTTFPSPGFHFYCHSFWCIFGRSVYVLCVTFAPPMKCNKNECTLANLWIAGAWRGGWCHIKHTCLLINKKKKGDTVFLASYCCWKCDDCSVWLMLSIHMRIPLQISFCFVVVFVFYRFLQSIPLSVRSEYEMNVFVRCAERSMLP